MEMRGTRSTLIIPEAGLIDGERMGLVGSRTWWSTCFVDMAVRGGVGLYGGIWLLQRQPSASLFDPWVVERKG